MCNKSDGYQTLELHCTWVVDRGLESPAPVSKDQEDICSGQHTGSTAQLCDAMVLCCKDSDG